MSATCGEGLWGAGPRTVRILDHDPDLGEGTDAASFEELRRAAVAPTVTCEPGTWRPGEQFGAGCEHFGLLVLEGILTREAQLAGASATELLGPGDLLRPWDDDEFLSAPVESSWTVLERARLAVLDRHLISATARWPSFAITAVGRYVRRARWLVLQLALHHQRRVDARLLVLLWNLADRFGRVRPEGVLVPLSLKHELLGRLVGAQRPSVTTALGELARQELVRSVDDGWLLLGGDPREGLSGYLRRAEEG